MSKVWNGLFAIRRDFRILRFVMLERRGKIGADFFCLRPKKCLHFPGKYDRLKK